MSLLYAVPLTAAQQAVLSELEVQTYSVLAEHALGELALASDPSQVIRAEGFKFYIVDRQLQHIVTLSLSEDLLEAEFGELGRSGQGPGEFGNPGSAGLRENGDLWVVDSGLGRLTTFSDRGPEDVNLPARQGARSGGHLSTRGVFGDGSLLLREWLGLEAIERTSITTTRLFRSSVDGDVVDLIAELDGAHFWLRVLLDGDSEFRSRQPWSFADQWALQDRGRRLVTVRQQERGSDALIDVTAFGPDASEIATFKYEIEERTRTKLSDETIDAWIDVHLDSSLGERFPSRRAGRKAFRDGLFLPKHLPPVKSLHVGYDETTWVELHGLPHEPSRWLVLDLELRPIRFVEIGAGLEVYNVSNDLIVAVQRNAFDDPSLVFLRP